jgi:chorismate mutase
VEDFTMRCRSKKVRFLIAQLRAAESAGTLESGQKEAAITAIREIMRAIRTADHERVESAVRDLVRVFLK